MQLAEVLIKPILTEKANAQQEKLKSASEEIQKTANENTKYDDAYFAVPAAPSLRKPGEPASKPQNVPPAPGQK